MAVSEALARLREALSMKAGDEAQKGMLAALLEAAEVDVRAAFDYPSSELPGALRRMARYWRQEWHLWFGEYGRVAQLVQQEGRVQPERVAWFLQRVLQVADWFEAEAARVEAQAA